MTFNKPSGFTLIELMIAIAIFAILMAVGIPGLQNLRSNTNVDSFSQLLMRGLSRAREEGSSQINNFAIICGSDDGLSCTDNTWDDGWIIFIGADPIAQDPDVQLPAQDDILWVENTSTFEVLVANGAPDWVGFNGFNASIPALANTFTICGPNRDESSGKLISISNSGSLSRQSGLIADACN
ncbi:MAG: prepilin-type N-terminal cleavage/methylation domain-containing protein [Cellvibrionaceae bacterium]|jgi:prepilin-type N-terminal cleavage/methylation domain-containing protein